MRNVTEILRVAFFCHYDDLFVRRSEANGSDLVTYHGSGIRLLKEMREADKVGLQKCCRCLAEAKCKAGSASEDSALR